MISCNSTDNGILDIFLMAGADVNSQTDYGSSAFQMACGYNQVGTAEALIAAGANVDEEDFDRDSPLLNGIRHGDLQIIELLLRHGANIHGQNKHGYTVLHTLAHHGTIETIKPFMFCQLRGLNTEKKNKAGFTAWEALLDRPTLSDELKGAFKALLAKCKADNDNTTDVEPVELRE